ncbi:MAG: hypothetical protein IJ743_00505 [Bacilli bacterium]|nr:hypothetical protein [Methanobrevibacter sp.]MBR1748256.1 hypothetical protein [Bacilli bacterium]
MDDHRGLNIDEINNHIEDIVEINDIYVPYQISGAFLDVSQSLKNKLFENQKEFIIDYRYEKYWRKGETKYEMDQRLRREFVEVHPELESLLPKTGETVEEHQEKMKMLYPDHIPYDYTPREV